MTLITTATFLTFILCEVGRDKCLPLNKPVVPEGQPSDPYSDSIEPVAVTEYGSVRGYLMRTIRNRAIAAYEGIPYARPPIGYFRFRAPVPPEPWTSIRDAKGTSSECLQIDLSQYFRVHGHEDCLYLNVYSTQLDTNKQSAPKKLPVILFIHGGGHTFGTGSIFGPAYLLDKWDVILVTFNFRLGILGYLTTKDSESPGNYALKDQALALHWVQRNIGAFGGDPTRITLIGQSSGSAAVGLHLISPKTRDIPYAAIMMSGHPLGFWGVLNRTGDSSRMVARAMGCPTLNSKDMVDCLRSKNPYSVVGRQIKAIKKLTYPLINFGPVLESPCSKEAFLTEYPETAYRNRNVSQAPVLMGLLQHEGDFFGALAYLQQLYPRLGRDPGDILPYLLEYQGESSVEQDMLSKRILKYYLNKKPISFESRLSFSKMIGDRYFASPIRKGLELHSKMAPTYGYVFNYTGQHSALEGLGLNRKDWHITHGDDLAYFLNSTLYFKPFRTRDMDFPMVEFMTNVWTNFAAKGKPVYTNGNGEDIEFWGPVQYTPGQSLNILEMNEESRMTEFPFEHEYRFWNRLRL